MPSVSGMIISGDVLSLDLATTSGYAEGPFSERPQFGTFILPSTGDAVGRFIAAYDDWLQFKLDSTPFDLVIYEAPNLFMKTTPITVEKLTGLATHTQLVCHRRRVRCRSANASQVKKHFTGKGNAKKDAMFARARALGFLVGDDNAADAVAIWHWALECYGSDVDKDRFRQARFETGMGVNQKVGF